MIRNQSGLISFVIPAMNEDMTLSDLYAGICKEMEKLPWGFEVIFIDDGSTDGTWGVMEKLAQKFANVRSLQFRQNLGKARALAAGFECAKGDLVFTMDADLQDDPREIPRFINKMAEGFDVLSGYKKKRHDPWHKVWPSRVFNRMINFVAGTDLHDHNCGFKCYRREVIEQLNPYGEMHRMLASLSSFEGYHVGELIVEHRPREFGCSKYGMKRFLRGFMDMLTVGFLGHYGERPMHLSGIISLFIFAGASLSLLLGAYFYVADSALSTVFLIAGLLSPLMAFPILGVGLVAELIISGRLAYRSRPNVIRDSQVYLKRKPNVNGDSREDPDDALPKELERQTATAQQKPGDDDSERIRPRPSAATGKRPKVSQADCRGNRPANAS